MTDAILEILRRALALPPAERVRLAHELLGSVVEHEADDFDPEFLAELDRRKSDPTPGIPADEAFAEVDRRLAERRSRDEAG